MAAKIGIPVPHEAIAEFCRRHGIRRLAFFGSVTRDDFTSQSDVDVLVEFEPGRAPGLITFGQYEIELAKILGRRVDLNTPRMLGRFYREEALSEVKLEE
jgi:hypothetical protein